MLPSRAKGAPRFARGRAPPCRPKAAPAVAAPPSHTVFSCAAYCPLLLCRRDDDAPPLTISYTLPMMTLSGVHVRFLRIAMRGADDATPGAKGPAPTRWVRYCTEAGEHHHRLRAEGQPAPPPMPAPPLREPWKPPPPPPPSAVVATATATPAATVAAAPAATPTCSRLKMDTATSAEEREEEEKAPPQQQQQQHGTGTATTTTHLAQLKELNSSLQTEHAELRRRVAAIEAAESQDTSAAEANRALQAENDALRKRLAALESGSGTALQDENAELQRRLATLEAASAAASPSSSAVIAATAPVVFDVV